MQNKKRQLNFILIIAILFIVFFAYYLTINKQIFQLYIYQKSGNHNDTNYKNVDQNISTSSKIPNNLETVLKIELDLNIDDNVEKYYTFSFKVHKTLMEQLKALNKNQNNYDFNVLFSVAK